MKHKNSVKSRKLSVKSLGVATLLTFTFSLSTATAQTSVNASGGDASGSGGSASYSVGQVTYLTHTETNSYLLNSFNLKLNSSLARFKSVNYLKSNELTFLIDLDKESNIKRIDLLYRN